MPDSAAGRLRNVYSFPVTLASTLVALAVLTRRSRFNDPDLWWHLRTGQIIWTSRAIPRTDLLSFTTGQHAWVAHEWLSQLSMYAAWRAGEILRSDAVVLCRGGGALSHSVHLLSSLFGQREGCIPGSVDYLVFRHHRSGDPSSTVGIHLPRLRTSGAALGPMARPALVLSAAFSFRSMGERARLVLPWNDHTGGGPRFGIVPGECGLTPIACLRFGPAQNSAVGLHTFISRAVREPRGMAATRVPFAH